MSLFDQQLMHYPEAVALCQEQGWRVFAPAWTTHRVRFEFEPRTRCLKRFYADSTHTSWPAAKAGELPRLMSGYLDGFTPSRRERIEAKAWLWIGAAANRLVLLVNTVTRRPVVTEERLRAAFRWALGVRSGL